MAARKAESVLWLCPVLMLMLGIWVFTWMGFSIVAAILVSLLLVCPSILIYGAVVAFRRKKGVKDGSCRRGP